jgi:N utilization substance protein B
VRQRTKARQRALQLMYAWEARGARGRPDELLSEFVREDGDSSESTRYLAAIVERMSDNLADLDRSLSRALTNWRLDRLSTIDRNILRIASAEMTYDPDVPPRVSIQEAIHLAERFSTPESTRFVNGVLDALMRRLPAEDAVDMEAT